MYIDKNIKGKKLYIYGIINKLFLNQYINKEYTLIITNKQMYIDKNKKYKLILNIYHRLVKFIDLLF